MHKLATYILLLLLAGCAASPSKQQQTSPTKAVIATPASAAAKPPQTASVPQVATAGGVNKPSSDAPKQKAPLKIAFLYVGPIGDGGWTFQHDLGRRAVEKQFGSLVATSYVEKVPEGADAEVVIRRLVSQGHNLIFGTTFGYMEPLTKLAPEFKTVKFEHATGYKTAENLRTYDSRTYEGAYLAGVVAGRMSKSGTLGLVASIPIPEIIRNINSFTLGAQLSNPKVRTKVVWVNSWYDPPKEAQAAASLVNAGADVLFQTTDSEAVLQTAQKMGKRAIGWDSDMTHYAPKAHLGSAIVNWAPYYIKSTQDAIDGKWSTGSAWWGVKEGAIDMVSIAPDVPEETIRQIDQIKSGLRAGTYSIWKKPLLGQDGREVATRNAVGSYDFLTQMYFYVKGVEGKIPGSDKK